MPPMRRSSKVQLTISSPKISKSVAAPVETGATSQRTRKLQPGIKERVEKYLENATKSTQSEFTNPRKRKASSLEDESTKPMTTPAKKTTSSQPSKIRETTSKKKIPAADEEKRMKMFRKKAPQTFLQKLERAQTQRMFVVGRQRVDTEASPKEEIDIIGSTGNVYRVTVGQITSCTCPDSKKGNECKHKVYALHTVLKAPEHLQYQLAFLSSELREIFANAPPIPTESSSSHDTDGNRKSVEGECPICYMDFDEEHNELLWCKAACGNNMHKSCFDKWVNSQNGKTVKCVYCRTPWHTDHGDMKEVVKAGSITAEGYVNVAEHFGMSQARDYSSYHQPWVRRQFGVGW